MSQQSPYSTPVQTVPLSQDRKSALTKIALAGVGLFVLGLLLRSSLGEVAIVLVIIGASFFYFIPSIVAFSRNHASKAGILVVNIAFGWTVLGWILSLAWSLSNPGNDRPAQVTIYNASQPSSAVPQYFAPPPPVPQVGQIANGYRFDGQQWVPLIPNGDQP